MPFDERFLRDAVYRAAGKRADSFRQSRTRGAGMFFVASGFEPKGLLFGPKGFNGAYVQSDLAEVNRRLARELAQLTADTMQAGLKRPKVSSKRLYYAILDPENRFSNAFGFGVGDPEWLDRSEAKYWRQIDQGFTGHLGREIRGLWGESLTGAYRIPASGGTPYPVAGAPYTQFGANESGRLIPMKRNSARNILRKGRSLGSRDARKRFSAYTKGVISQPIEAQGYFLEAWEAFDVKRRYIETIKAVFAKSGGIPTQAWIDFQTGNGPYVPPSKRFRNPYG